MLQTLKLKNWRSFREQTIQLAGPGAETGGLKVFIGANASGKSNLLDALRLLREAVEEDLAAAMTRRGGIENVLFRRSQGDEHISIELTRVVFHPEVGIVDDLCYMLEIGEQDGTLGAVSEILRMESSDSEDTEPFGEGDLFNAHWGQGTALPLIIIGGYSSIPIDTRDPSVLVLKAIGLSTFSISVFPQVIELGKFIQSWRFIGVDPNAIRAPQYTERTTSLDPDAGNLANVLRTLADSAPQKLEAIRENLRFILGHVQDLSTDDQHGLVLLALKEPFFEDAFDARSISDGTLRILAILTALELMPEPGLLAIEEPEHSIHPLAFGLLVDTIREYCEGSRRQVLLTTHSAEFLDAVNRPEEVLVVERDEQTGESVVKELDAEKLKEWLQDFRLGELWRMRHLGGVPS